jgi:DNA polymerase-1
MATASSTQTLYLVDGTAQLYRAYFALPGLTNDEGLPTHAVYGYISMLRKLISEEAPPLLAVVFDPPGPVFRHERFAEYKANRPETPEDLRVQLPYAKQATETLGVTILEQSGYEADDLIAAYTALARRAGMEVVVVSSDKDLLQLVGDGVRVLNPTKNVKLDPAAVVEQFGVPPTQVSDVLGLMGDSVDNIPGVPGVGEKTALSVVGTYGDLEAVIARARRFTVLFDARDRLLEVVLAVERSARLEELTAREANEAAERFAAALREFTAHEADAELAARMNELTDRLREADFPALADAVSRPGREAARSIKPLKKELKAIERGSSKRIWYRIHENADQARMSKELATLQPEAPVETPVDELTLKQPERDKALELFRVLGFRALIDEFVGSEGSENQPSSRPECCFESVLSRDLLQEVVAGCREAGRFAVCSLTVGADPMRARPVGIALSHAPGQGWYVPTGHQYLDAPVQLSAETVAELLGPLMADERVEKVAHDLKFEHHLLQRHGIEIRGRCRDTMVIAFLLNSSRSSYAVGELAREFLGENPPGDVERGDAGLESVDVEQLTEHAAGRAELVLRLDSHLEPLLERAGLERLYDTVDGPLLPLLARMEARGIRVDAGLLEEMSREMEASLGRARAEIHRFAGAEFNVDSPKQLREVLFERLGLKPRRKTAKSKVASTDAQTLEELADEHAIAREILAYRELAKLKGTYVDTLPRLIHPETGRVHTRFHPTGAATGRLSSSDPNLQNIPARTAAGRRIRSAFVPESGFGFLASDYSQVELRVLAHLTGDEELIAAFRAGEDIHRFTASQVFGVIPDLVSAEMRQRAKAVNFGILYGMSEIRLAREQGMKRTEARNFIRAYFERFAKVRGYIERVRDQARRDGAVRTMFGRVRYFPQLRQKVNRAVQEQALRAAVNTTIQGTAADLMKLAMLRVDEELRRAGSQSRILLQVHDELLLEIPEGEADEIPALVRAAMESVHRLEVPLAVDQKTGASWLEVT